jgi:hypothetical protein
MKKFLFTVIAAAVLPAHALTVTTIDRAPVAIGPILSIVDASGPGGLERATALLINSSFIAYCAEYQTTLPRAAGGLPAVYAEGTFGAKQADLVKAASYMYNTGVYDPATKEQAALNQAIFWEILNEDSGSYSFSTGDFKISSTGRDAALSFDFNLLNSADAHRSVYVTALTNSTYQDLLTVSAVPEPSTYALMLAGLAGVGFLARRRRAD